MKRILLVSKKEIIHIIREPRIVYIAFVMPVILLILFGYALNLDLREANLLFVDRDGSILSRKLANFLKNSGYFKTTCVRNLPAEGLEVWRTFNFVVEIPQGFEEKLKRGRFEGINVLIDGMDDNIARQINSQLSVILWEFIRRELGFETGDKFYVTMWYNPSFSSRPFIVIGLISIITLVLSALLTCITFSKEFETRTIELLWRSPLKEHEIVVGKALPYFLISLLSLWNILIVGKFVFKIPLRGSLWEIILVACVYTISGISYGMIFSAIARDQRLALQITWLSTILPSFLLSGFIFPLENMPFILRSFSYLVPAKYFIEIARGLFLKGASLFDYTSSFVILLTFMLILVLLTVFTLKKSRRL